MYQVSNLNIKHIIKLTLRYHKCFNASENQGNGKFMANNEGAFKPGKQHQYVIVHNYNVNSYQWDVCYKTLWSFPQVEPGFWYAYAEINSD